MILIKIDRKKQYPPNYHGNHLQTSAYKQFNVLGKQFFLCVIFPQKFIRNFLMKVSHCERFQFFSRTNRDKYIFHMTRTAVRVVITWTVQESAT